MTQYKNVIILPNKLNLAQFSYTDKQGNHSSRQVVIFAVKELDEDYLFSAYDMNLDGAFRQFYASQMDNLVLGDRSIHSDVHSSTHFLKLVTLLKTKDMFMQNLPKVHIQTLEKTQGIVTYTGNNKKFSLCEDVESADVIVLNNLQGSFSTQDKEFISFKEFLIRYFDVISNFNHKEEWYLALLENLNTKVISNISVDDKCVAVHFFSGKNFYFSRMEKSNLPVLKSQEELNNILQQAINFDTLKLGGSININTVDADVFYRTHSPDKIKELMKNNWSFYKVNDSVISVYHIK